jgi:hypothetical protein
MLKRNIAILIAGGLLSVQAGLAGAQATIPPSGDDVIYTLLPASAQYFAQREAANPNPTGAAGSAVPSSGQVSGRTLPGQAKYFADREARVVNDRAAYLNHNADGHMTRSSGD